MAKSLSQRIADRMSKKPAKAGGQNRAAFLALKPDIEEALADRWPVKSIWETLYAEGKIRFSYQAFRRYVNALIPSMKEPGSPPASSLSAAAPFIPDAAKRESPAQPAKDKQSLAGNEKQRTPAPAADNQPRSPGADGFDFNPNPNAEEYL